MEKSGECKIVNGECMESVWWVNVNKGKYNVLRIVFCYGSYIMVKRWKLI